MTALSGRAAVALLVVALGLAACTAAPGGQGSAAPGSAATPTPAVAPPSQPPSSPAPPTASILAPTPAPSPSSSAAPSSSPAPSGLLVRLDVCADVCVDPRQAEYLGDGRVIAAGRDGATFLVRRLSADGLARVRDLLASHADLLAADLSVDAVPMPGKDPPAHGVISYTLIAPTTAGGRATVRTFTSGSLETDLWVPDERRDRLSALGDALLDPETLAGAGGWVDAAWSSYAPERTAVFVHAREGAEPFSSPDLGPDGWPGGSDPTQFGAAFASPLDAWPISRCAVMPAADAAELAAGLPAGALSPEDASAAWREGTIGWADDGLELMVLFRALLPDEEALPCGDLWPYGA
jgi:hypothetical protein